MLLASLQALQVETVAVSFSQIVSYIFFEKNLCKFLEISKKLTLTRLKAIWRKFVYAQEVQRTQRSPRTFSKSMYGTRPCCLVQAITRHTCPGPHLGSWNCLPHQAHIALSEPMSSIDQQGLSLGSFSTFPPPLYPHFNRPSGFWPRVKSCLVGGSDK